MNAHDVLLVHRRGSGRARAMSAHEVLDANCRGSGAAASAAEPESGR